LSSSFFADDEVNGRYSGNSNKTMSDIYLGKNSYTTTTTALYCRYSAF
jgi:hypothetical protein